MEQPKFLSWEIVAALHRRSLERWGGIDGVRDRAGLESALGAAENAFFYGGGDVMTLARPTPSTWRRARGFLMATSGRPSRARPRFWSATDVLIARTILNSTTP